jgi:hypothetical protein
MPIETLVPLEQAPLDEAIWTFHAPSKVAARAGVATAIAARNRMRVAKSVLLKCCMTYPLGFDAINVSHRFGGDCDESHTNTLRKNFGLHDAGSRLDVAKKGA